MPPPQPTDSTSDYSTILINVNDPDGTSKSYRLYTAPLIHHSAFFRKKLSSPSPSEVSPHLSIPLKAFQLFVNYVTTTSLYTQTDLSETWSQSELDEYTDMPNLQRRLDHIELLINAHLLSNSLCAIQFANKVMCELYHRLNNHFRDDPSINPLTPELQEHVWKYTDANRRQSMIIRETPIYMFANPPLRYVLLQMLALHYRFAEVADRFRFLEDWNDVLMRLEVKRRLNGIVVGKEQVLGLEDYFV